MTSAERSSARRAPRWYLVLGMLLGGSLWLYLRPVDVPARWQGATMGTTYTVRLAEALAPELHAHVGTELQAELTRLTALHSTYEADSEVSRLSRAEAGRPLPLSADTTAVLYRAEVVSKASGGAFDVTVAPLVDIWGFGPGGRPSAVPDRARVDAAHKRVNYRSLELDPERRTLVKRAPGVQLDLSGIAKGYAVDKLAQLLDARGFGAYLVEIGGEARARGVNASGRPWRIAVERPGGGAIGVELDNRGIASSGNYRNYYERDGDRLVHTIEPRTGRPVRHPLAAVTVIHEDTALADAWATALMVLGDEQGLVVAESEGLAALFFVMKGETLVSRRTATFPEVTL